MNPLLNAASVSPYCITISLHVDVEIPEVKQNSYEARPMCTR